MKFIYNKCLMLTLVVVCTTFFSVPQAGLAQGSNSNFQFQSEESLVATSTTTTTNGTVNAEDATPSTTAAGIISQRELVQSKDITQPEELSEKVAIISLFEDRLVDKLGWFNGMAFWVQESVRAGVPANTIFLILLTPFLALLVSFVRTVVGLPTLDMLVPIALAFALVAVGITVGLLVLSAILIASYISKISLTKLKIMFYPKRSLSMVLLSLAVFAALSVGVVLDFERILSVSIFPILVLMLLGDMIVSVQLHKSSSETFMITATTIVIGLVGYLAATSIAIQNFIILYPEVLFLVIPANILVGRYFGLRLFEVFRFNKVSLD